MRRGTGLSRVGSGSPARFCMYNPRNDFCSSDVPSLEKWYDGQCRVWPFAHSSRCFSVNRASVTYFIKVDLPHSSCQPRLLLQKKMRLHSDLGPHRTPCRPCQCMLRVLVGTNHRPRTICHRNKRGERPWRSPRCISDLCRCSCRPQVLSSRTSSSSPIFLRI